MPCCRDSWVPVRTSVNRTSATSALVFHAFCPLTTYSSPSRRADARSEAKSEPAPGSE